MLRPKKYNLLQLSLQRVEDHSINSEVVPPLVPPPHSLDVFALPTAVLRDIRTGYGIRTLAAGLTRCIGSCENSQWRVRDVPARYNVPIRHFISLLCGLVLIINIDWYGHSLIISLDLIPDSDTLWENRHSKSAPKPRINL